MDRRSALKTIALGTLAASATSRLPAQATQPAQIPAAPAKPVSPGFHRFSVGKFEVIALNDGIGRMQPIQPTWAPEGTPDQIKAALEKHFLPTDRLHTAFNALLVRTGKETILLDSGNGGRGQPRTGWLSAQLAAAGVATNEITGLFLSHAHGDHFGGLLDADGKPVFPNAALHVAAAERDFWFSEKPDFSGSHNPGQDRSGAIKGARRVFDTLRSNTTAHAEGATIADGLSLIAAPGHTPGHSGLRIASDGEELLYLADLAHHPVLMFEHPEWTVAFDTHARQAAATRAKLFAELAAKRSRVHLFHMPFPGVGHIRATGADSYEWVPEMWTVLG